MHWNYPTSNLTVPGKIEHVWPNFSSNLGVHAHINLGCGNTYKLSLHKLSAKVMKPCIYNCAKAEINQPVLMGLRKKTCFLRITPPNLTCMLIYVVLC